MVFCISCHFKSQGIEACKHGVVVGAVVVERDLTLMLGLGKCFLQLGAYLEPKRVGMGT